MISCNDAHEHFSAYWEEELSAARRERLESHWTTCESCRGEYETFAAAMRAVRALPRLAAPDDLSSRVLARVRAIEASRPAAWWAPSRLFDWAAWRADWSWRPALAAAAAVVAVVAGVAVVQQGLVDRPNELPQTPIAAGGPAPQATGEPETADGDRITATESALGDRMAGAAPGATAPSVESPAAEPDRAVTPRDAGPQELLAERSPASGNATSFLDSLLLHGGDVEYALDRIQLRNVPGDSGLTPMPAMPGAPEGKPASLTF